MNPWDAVDLLRFLYGKRIEEEHRTHEGFLASRDEDAKCRWDAARKSKAVAYVAYVEAVGAAVKSGTPCPW